MEHGRNQPNQTPELPPRLHDAFMLIALLFALSMPLLLFIRIKKGEKADLSQAH